MNLMTPPRAETRLLMSGNEAVARGAWEAGVAVAAAYPGTPSTEILESLTRYPDLHAQWSTNEKVALEVAIGASMVGARGLAAMKQVGLNVASDPLMSITLAGVVGGLVIAVADDIGISSSQNEQDSRHWGRFGHMPVLEPADTQEALEMTRAAFDISERFQTPVILRLTTRICHVKGVVTVGQRQAHDAQGFHTDPNRWVMTPKTAKLRQPQYLERDAALRAFAAETDLNRVEDGPDRRVGFVTSGPAAMHVREAFPNAPVFKLGLGHPLPLDGLRAFAETVETLVVAEETEPLVETEIRAAGIPARGKDLLPRIGELLPDVLRPALASLIKPGLIEPGETAAARPAPPPALFPRPPTMCAACPHSGMALVLSRLRRNVTVLGDIGCYALMSGPPWNAMDTAVCMGSSMGISLGVDKGLKWGGGEADANKHLVAIIGDSTFLHTGIQGLLDIVYNGGDVTVVIADNRAVGMTGGQDHPASGRDARGEEAPRVDFAALVAALGVPADRIHEVDPYEIPTLFKTTRDAIRAPGVSVLITNRPCVLTDRYAPLGPLFVDADACSGCANCLDVGCPLISVTDRETVTLKTGKTKDLAYVTIDSASCTGCGICVKTCADDAILPLTRPDPATGAVPLEG
ncbi:MAG: indolepyruvate ferredoxin oxidoreductase subunit alpha [Rhodobacterales bacterium]|nr:indolepyruvate ferredoxin oxidoreductase subunit alpha [Rhodobacterales bacterium]